jgi:hypothetical protein
MKTKYTVRVHYRNDPEADGKISTDYCAGYPGRED